MPPFKILFYQSILFHTFIESPQRKILIYYHIFQFLENKKQATS